MKSVSKILTVMTLCAAAACGSSNSNPPSSPAASNGNSTVVGDGNATDGNTANGGSLSVLTVSGTITNFAFDANATINDTNTLQVGVLDSNNLYPNGTLQVVSATPVQASDCTTAAGVRTCKFSISKVDTHAFTGDLLVVTSDSRLSVATGDTTQWQSLATLVSPNALSAAQAGGTLSGVNVHTLSSAGRTAFSNLAGTASAGLTTTGAVIGLITGTDGTAPVAGATVAGSSVYYANADVTSGSATGPTSTNGLFLAVPASKTAGALSASTTITAPSGSTSAWTVPAVPAVSPLWLVVDLAASK